MSDLIIERRFAANVDTVFSFFTKTENLVKWWGPEAMSLQDVKLDFTEPGSWTSTMVNAEGVKYKVSGEVVSVDPPNSVELTWGWHDENDARGNESQVRFEVKPNKFGGTDFALIHIGLADDEIAQNHNIGWTSALKKLERLAEQ